MPSRVHSLRFNQLRWVLVVGTAPTVGQPSPWDSNPFAFQPLPAQTLDLLTWIERRGPHFAWGTPNGGAPDGGSLRNAAKKRSRTVGIGPSLLSLAKPLHTQSRDIVKVRVVGVARDTKNLGGRCNQAVGKRYSMPVLDDCSLNGDFFVHVYQSEVLAYGIRSDLGYILTLLF